jgi:hypothetical protein
MVSSEGVQPAASGSSIMNTLRRPAVLLILLATWEIIGIIVQLLSVGAFFEVDNKSVDGILSGQGFANVMVVPAIIYLYAARDADRFRRVLWLAFIEHTVAIVSYYYQLGSRTFGLEGVIIPTAVSGGFLFLILLVMFVPRQETQALPAAGQPPTPSR